MSSTAGQEQASPINVGRRVFICTVTKYYLGEIIDVIIKDETHVLNQIVLKNAVWVGNTGPLANFMRDGTSSGMEIEEYPEGPLAINADTIVDVFDWGNKPIPPRPAEK